MKVLKKTAGILLSCILLLCTACSGGADTSEDTTGSANDSEHTYHEYKYALFVKEDELFTLAGEDKETVSVYTPEAQEKYVVELTTEETTADNDANKVPEPEIKELEDCTLTVYSLYDHFDINMQYVIQAFTKNHPNITVNVEIGIPDESSITPNDALQALNVKMLAGDGPDILFMDGMNIEKYVEAGFLTDLSDVYDSLTTHYPNIYRNMLNAFREEDGRLYALPTNFNTQVIVGKQEALSEISDIETLYAFLSEHGNCEEGNELEVYYPEELFDKFKASYIHTIIDKNGMYHEENLRNFISTLKDLWLLIQEETTEEEKKLHEEEFAENNSLWNNLSMALRSILMNGLNKKDKKGAQLAVGTMGFVSCTYSIRSILSDLDGYDMQIFSANSQNVFEPCLILAVSSKTQNEAAAKCFVEEQYRREVMKYGGAWNKNSRTGILIRFAEFDPFDEFGFMYGLGEDGFELTYGFPNREEKTFFDTFFSKLDAPVYIDKYVDEILKNNIAAYFDGKITIDEYMDGVNERLTLYLKE